MSTISTNDFFKTPREQSEIKSEILNTYFKAWAAILLIGQRKIPIRSLAYIDLYAGTGYYEDGNPSTPIKILKSISTERIFNEKVKTFFNDTDASVTNTLNDNVTALPFYNQLIHKPVILNKEANKELLKELLSKEQTTPTLTFIDPFGYKGVSADLCLMAVKNWGSDLFMLFNMNRIRPGIKNTCVAHLMADLFGDKLDAIIERYDKLNVKDREDLILSQFVSHFEKKKYRALKFKVEFEGKKGSSHYLLFVSKVDIAYFKMKEIMAKYSDYQQDGVPWFAVNNSEEQHLFTEFSIVNLKATLLSNKGDFEGKSVEDIYQLSSIDKPYIKENYKQAYLELIKEGKVIAVDKNGKEKQSPAFTSIIKYK